MINPGSSGEPGLEPRRLHTQAPAGLVLVPRRWVGTPTPVLLEDKDLGLGPILLVPSPTPRGAKGWLRGLEGGLKGGRGSPDILKDFGLHPTVLAPSPTSRSWLDQVCFLLAVRQFICSMSVETQRGLFFELGLCIL